MSQFGVLYEIYKWILKTVFECKFAPVRQQKRKADPELENLTL
jgi:hypothetical protein